MEVTSLIGLNFEVKKKRETDQLTDHQFAPLRESQRARELFNFERDPIKVRPKPALGIFPQLAFLSTGLCRLEQGLEQG